MSTNLSINAAISDTTGGISVSASKTVAATGETTQTFQFQFKVTNTGTEVADES